MRLKVALIGGGVLLAAAIVIAYLVTTDVISPITGGPGQFTEECGPRPADLAITEKQFELSGVNIGKVALGKLEVRSTPEVFEALSQASRSNVVVDYLICVATERGDIERGNREQSDYLRRMLSYLETGPTAEQFEAWQKDNPFPKRVGRLELPDFQDAGGKKVLQFSPPRTVRTVRIINAGDGALNVWLEQFPGEVFFPSPDSGPWTLTPQEHRDLSIIFMNVRTQEREFPFRVKTASGEIVQAAIQLEGDWRLSDATEIGSSLIDRMPPPGSAPGAVVSPRSLYELTKAEVGVRYDVLDDVTKDVFAGQILLRLSRPEAALVAFEAAQKKSPALVSNPSHQLLLATAYTSFGNANEANEAFAKYQKLEGDPQNMKVVLNPDSPDRYLWETEQKRERFPLIGTIKNLFGG